MKYVGRSIVESSYENASVEYPGQKLADLTYSTSTIRKHAGLAWPDCGE